MNLNRRGFFAALAAGLTLDPERALWVPGRKLISIPRPLSTRWEDFGYPYPKYTYHTQLVVELLDSYELTKSYPPIQHRALGTSDWTKSDFEKQEWGIKL